MIIESSIQNSWFLHCKESTESETTKAEKLNMNGSRYALNNNVDEVKIGKNLTAEEQNASLILKRLQFWPASEPRITYF